MMEPTAISTNHNQQTLESVQRRIQHWREKRKKGQKIPKELWEAACLLFPRYSIHEISQELKLDYVGLRNRIHPVPKEGNEPYFVELSMGRTRSEVDCKLKVRDGRGGRIKIKMRKGAVGRLIELMSGLMDGSL
jgi:hypothetical protein